MYNGRFSFVLRRFQHFGEITKNDIDKTTPYLKLTYATRANAEQAMLRGRRFNDKQLQVSVIRRRFGLICVRF